MFAVAISYLRFGINGKIDKNKVIKIMEKFHDFKKWGGLDIYPSYKIISILAHQQVVIYLKYASCNFIWCHRRGDKNVIISCGNVS